MKSKEKYVESMPIIEKKKISTLVWAKSHSYYPYWPCIILHPADLSPQMRKSAYGKQNNSANSHLVRYLGYDYNPKEGKIGYIGSVKFDKIKKWNANNFKLFGDDYEANIADAYQETFRLALDEVSTRTEEVSRRRIIANKAVKIEEVISTKKQTEKQSTAQHNENNEITNTKTSAVGITLNNDTGCAKGINVNAEKETKCKKRKRVDEEKASEYNRQNDKKDLDEPMKAANEKEDNCIKKSIQLDSDLIKKPKLSTNFCTVKRRHTELTALVNIVLVFGNKNPFKSELSSPSFVINYYDVNTNKNLQHVLTDTEAIGIANFMETYVYKRRRGRVDDIYLSSMKNLLLNLQSNYDKHDEKYFSELFYNILIKKNKSDAKLQIKKMISGSSSKQP